MPQSKSKPHPSLFLRPVPSTPHPSPASWAAPLVRSGFSTPSPSAVLQYSRSWGRQALSSETPTMRGTHTVPPAKSTSSTDQAGHLVERASSTASPQQQSERIPAYASSASLQRSDSQIHHCYVEGGHRLFEPPSVPQPEPGLPAHNGPVLEIVVVRDRVVTRGGIGLDLVTREWTFSGQLIETHTPCKQGQYITYAAVSLEQCCMKLLCACLSVCIAGWVSSLPDCTCYNPITSTQNAMKRTRLLSAVAAFETIT